MHSQILTTEIQKSSKQLVRRTNRERASWETREHRFPGSFGSQDKAAGRKMKNRAAVSAKKRHIFPAEVGLLMVQVGME